MLGKGIDAYRVASWVRKHDAVIAPGAGVLEVTLPVGPWWYPYAMFLVSVSGRVTGTKVAMVSVGAREAGQRLTRRFVTTAAKLAFYCSYRDTGSYDAMRRAGVDVTNDHVYPDLAFALPVPPAPGRPADRRGGYHGLLRQNEDREQETEVHASYVEKMKHFVRWLAGTATGSGCSPVTTCGTVPWWRRSWTTCGPTRPRTPTSAVADAVTSLEALMREMARVGTVVGIRYHNLVCALKLGKPTVSLSYASKHDFLMADMGLWSSACPPGPSTSTS